MNQQIEQADITDDYVRLLDLQRAAPDLNFLSEIIRRHAALFAFSSVGPLLGDDLPLDVRSLYQRIVMQRRGGYCFEQNGLMYFLLKELGFKVSLVLARVIYNEDIHPGLTHRISLVEINGKSYIADVGFGPLGPQSPLCMSGETSQESFRVFRVEEREQGEFHLQTLKDGGYYSLYKFELARYGPADCEVGHFYSHKHPGATFVNHLVVSKIQDHEVLSLRNHEYRVITASGEQRHTIGDGPQLRQILDKQFGIRVSEDEASQLFEKTA